MFLNFLFFAAINKPGTNFFNFDNATNSTEFPLHELSKNKSYAFEDLANDLSALRSNFSDTFWQRGRREDSWTAKDDSSLATQPTTAKDNSTLAARPSDHVEGTEKINAMEKMTGDIVRNLFMDIAFPHVSRIQDFHPNSTNHNFSFFGLPFPNAFWQRRRREDSWTAKDDSSLATQPTTAKDNSTLAARPSTTDHIVGTEKISAVQKVMTGDIARDMFMDTAYPNISQAEEEIQPNSTNRNGSSFGLPFPLM